MSTCFFAFPFPFRDQNPLGTIPQRLADGMAETDDPQQKRGCTLSYDHQPSTKHHSSTISSIHTIHHYSHMI